MMMISNKLKALPLVPYHLINYTAGILRVNLMAFLWTTALGTLPYTISINSLFAGLRFGRFIPLIIGGTLFILSTILSIVFRRKID